MRKLKLLIAAGTIAGLASLTSAVPAHALDCQPGVVSTICSATIGTLCKVTKQNPCFP
jgi:hypothetical protein